MPSGTVYGCAVITSPMGRSSAASRRLDQTGQVAVREDAGQPAYFVEQHHGTRAPAAHSALGEYLPHAVCRCRQTHFVACA